MKRLLSFVVSFWLLLILLLLPPNSQASLEAAVILPHGDFAYDPYLVDTPEERRAAVDIAQSSRVAANFLHEEIDPDVILLITPHGIALPKDFGVYLGETANGYAEIGSDLHRPNATKYRVTLPSPIHLAPTLAQDLLEHLQGMNVKGISPLPNESTQMPLEWAEVIPLLLVYANATMSERTIPRQHIIWSQPTRRLDEDMGTNMVEELLQVGKRLFVWTEQRPERFAVLVSADLSHTHRADGPYGYSATSQPFDNFVQQWAQGQPCRNSQVLLKDATALQPHALSCGYTGMVLLHGMMCCARGLCVTENLANAAPLINSIRHERKWLSKVLVEKNVTYYGMMAATIQNADESVAQPS